MVNFGQYFQPTQNYFLYNIWHLSYSVSTLNYSLKLFIEFCHRAFSFLSGFLQGIRSSVISDSPCIDRDPWIYRLRLGNTKSFFAIKSSEVKKLLAEVGGKQTPSFMI